jgi:hypothetical protein
MTQRAWRISVNGVTTCCGVVTLLPASACNTSNAGIDDNDDVVSHPRIRFEVLCFVASPCARLRDPCAVLGAALLCAVTAPLRLRQRLACAAVCRAWRDALRPAGAASAAAWAFLDVSRAAFPLRIGAPRSRAELLTDAILPRYGRHVTHLTLGHARAHDDNDDDDDDDDNDDGLTDAALRAAAVACPRLAVLDLRGCGSLCRYTHGQSSAATTRLGRLLCVLYDRARAGTRLTLLLAASGAGACEAHDGACRKTAVRVGRALAQALTWRVKTHWDGREQCVFCCGWPAACGARAALLIESRTADVAFAQKMVDDTEVEAAKAAARADADAFVAAAAADAAAAAAHAAARAATAARFAPRDAATAAAEAAEEGADAAAAAAAAAVAPAQAADASAAAAADAARGLDDAEAQLAEAQNELEAACLEAQVW